MYQKILWALFENISHIWRLPLPSPSGQSQHESSSGFPAPSLFPFPTVFTSLLTSWGSDPISYPQPCWLSSSASLFSASETSIALFLPQGLFHVRWPLPGTHFPLRFTWLIAFPHPGVCSSQKCFLTSLYKRVDLILFCPLTLLNFPS